MAMLNNQRVISYTIPDFTRNGLYDVVCCPRCLKKFVGLPSKEGHGQRWLTCILPGSQMLIGITIPVSFLIFLWILDVPICFISNIIPRYTQYQDLWLVKHPGQPKWQSSPPVSRICQVLRFSDQPVLIDEIRALPHRKPWEWEAMGPAARGSWRKPDQNQPPRDTQGLELRTQESWTTKVTITVTTKVMSWWNKDKNSWRYKCCKFKETTSSVRTSLPSLHSPRDPRGEN